jgi:trans-aconitate methyltransferase
MNNLYTELATVYEAMYQTFIDYKEEYHFYHNLLKKYQKSEVVEIGCGTGNLANYFMNSDFEYTGLDLSEEMISLAQNKSPNARFMKADMRDFKLEKTIESIIITARTISYLLTNKDVNNTFQRIANNLEQGGVLCFDIIDANRFVPMVTNKKQITHEAIYKETTYVRKSDWKLHLANGIDFLWDAVYYKQEKEKFIEIGQDHSNIRTFTVNEIEIFLFINGFKIREIIDRPSYFFPTYVFVAEKIQ